MDAGPQVKMAMWRAVGDVVLAAMMPGMSGRLPIWTVSGFMSVWDGTQWMDSGDLSFSPEQGRRGEPDAGVGRGVVEVMWMDREILS